MNAFASIAFAALLLIPTVVSAQAALLIEQPRRGANEQIARTSAGVKVELRRNAINTGHRD